MASSHPGASDRERARDRKSTRLNSSHLVISYAVFCLKKKKYTSQPPSLCHKRPHTRWDLVHSVQSSRARIRSLPYAIYRFLIAALHLAAIIERDIRSA